MALRLRASVFALTKNGVQISSFAKRSASDDASQNVPLDRDERIIAGHFRRAHLRVVSAVTAKLGSFNEKKL